MCFDAIHEDVKCFELILNVHILKLVSTVFYQIFIFFIKSKPFKNIKNVFFIKKALFVLKILNFCNFFIIFPHFPDSKGQIEVGQFMMPWIGLHKFTNINVGINQKPLYITSSLIKEFFRTCFINWRATGH